MKLEFCPFFYHYFLFLHQENLVELKHHKLVRSIRSGTVSRDLKPNAKTRDQLNVWKRCFCFNYIIIGLLWASLVTRNPNFQVAILCMPASFGQNAIWSHVFGPSITCNLIMHVFDNLSCENYGVRAKVLTLDCCRWQSIAFRYYS